MGKKPQFLAVPRGNAPKKRTSKVVASSITNSEDILHEMLAAAANDGGRGWKKKKKLLTKKESARLISAVDLQASVSPKLSKESLLSEPFFRKFWKHKDDGGFPSDEVKLMRKLIGTRVTGCAPSPVSGIKDLRLPDFFRDFFSQTRGLKEATSVQMQAWPSLLNGSNVITVAPTGSGKTLAYSLCVACHVMAQRIPEVGEGPLAVILVPTRELALQVKRTFVPFRRLGGVRTVALYGGLLSLERKAQLCEVLENPVHILVATPGRLVELSSGEFVTENEETPKVPLCRVTMLVLDEVDRMLSLGFQQQIRTIVSKIRPDRQTACFSATLPGNLRQELKSMVGPDPTTIRVGAIEVVSNSESQQERVAHQDHSSVAMSDSITHEVLVCENEGEKLGGLVEYIKQVADKRVIVFCNKITAVETLAKALLKIKKPNDDDDSPSTEVEVRKKKRKGSSLWRVGILHGRLPQASRVASLKLFSSGKIQVLIATDLAGRGVHVSCLDHVVNYDLPAAARMHEMYPHRVGRTGRSGRSGHALSFVVKPNLDRGEMGSSGGGALELAALFSSNFIPLGTAFAELVHFLKHQTVNRQRRKENSDQEETLIEADEVLSYDDDDDPCRPASRPSGHWDREDFKVELWEFYAEKQPEKLSDVDRLVEKYWGVVDPSEFIAALNAKYS